MPPINNTETGSERKSSEGDQNRVSHQKYKFTKSAAIDAFTPPDNTIEVCGWVDVLESAKTVGQDRKYTVMKFVLNNNAGRRIQCSAWQKEVERAKNIITSEKIIHLKGAVANAIKKPQFNIGNTLVELILRDHTVIEEKGFFSDSIDAISQKPVVVSWEEVADLEGRYIEIDGWVKMVFTETKNKTGDAVYSIGAISDGVELKLAVRVMSSASLPTNISVGCAVTVRGLLQYDGVCPYLKVTQGSDVKLVKKHGIDPDLLMDAALIPQKRSKKESMKE